MRALVRCTLCGSSSPEPGRDMRLPKADGPLAEILDSGRPVASAIAHLFLNQPLCGICGGRFAAAVGLEPDEATRPWVCRFPLQALVASAESVCTEMATTREGRSLGKFAYNVPPARREFFLKLGVDRERLLADRMSAVSPAPPGLPSAAAPAPVPLPKLFAPAAGPAPASPPTIADDGSAPAADEIPAAVRADPLAGGRAGGGNGRAAHFAMEAKAAKRASEREACEA